MQSLPLDVSRINSGRFRLEQVPCDLAILLRHIADEFAAIAQHSGVTLNVWAPESLPGLWDRLAVEQVIDNLLSNAIKYGGNSSVDPSLPETDTDIHIHVRDHGKGIPAQRARVFERFERAVGHNEYRSGFGVGLWVVGPPRGESRHQAPITAWGLDMATVLIVDDEYGIVELLEAVLFDEGHRVLTASNGRHGLSVLETRKPDVIFLDYMMPIMDGASMLSHMRSDPALRDIPVVLMSSIHVIDVVNDLASKGEREAVLGDIPWHPLMV